MRCCKVSASSSRIATLRNAFTRLRKAGVRIATLTNFGEPHTRGLLRRAQLLDAVELVLTVDEVRAFKPHAAPYPRAADLLAAVELVLSR